MFQYDKTNYELSSYEKYKNARISIERLILDRAVCKVKINEKSRMVQLFTDPYFAELFASESEHKPLSSAKDILKIGKKNRGETVPDDKNIELDTLCKRFNIQLSDEAKTYYLNAISGSVITYPLGEGLLDYCYFDIEKNGESLRFLFTLFSKQGRDIQTLLRGYTPEPDKPVTINNQADSQKYIDEMWERTNRYCREFLYNSLYTAVFAPVFVDAESDMWRRYKDYLLLLQGEFQEKMQFCFDPDFYPSVLGNMTPSKRYVLYCNIHKQHPAWHNRTEKFALVADNDEENKINVATDSKEYSEFVSKYFGENAAEASMLQNNFSIDVHYTCSSIFDMLNLEFTKMLETGIRLRRCKRCGRYFIMKGNYDTNYCDKLLDGQTKTCQELAAQENYKAKAAENPALKIYSKYYKRYAARLKARQIKEHNFNKWRYEAMTKRDECSDGKITVDEYVEWLEGCFPNRTKKTSSDINKTEENKQ